MMGLVSVPYQLHGGTAGLAEIWIFILISIPLMLLGSALLVTNIVRLLRKPRTRARTERLTFVSSLLVAAGLVAVAPRYRAPDYNFFAECLTFGAALLAVLAIWTFRRSRAQNGRSSPSE